MNTFMFGFACILPSLEFVHGLIKFARSKDVFVSDLVQPSRFIKVMFIICIVIKFPIVDSFWAFKSWLDLKHENIHMRWIIDANFWISIFCLWTKWPTCLGNSIGFADHGAFYGNKRCIVVKSSVKNRCKDKPCNFFSFQPFALKFFFHFFHFFSPSCK
jgi:hypothetical protein